MLNDLLILWLSDLFEIVKPEFFGDFYTNLNNFGESFVFNILVETEYLDLPIYCFLVLIQETMGSIHQFDKNVKDQ